MKAFQKFIHDMRANLTLLVKRELDVSIVPYLGEVLDLVYVDWV
jgi:hypothetical protein